MYRVYAPAAAPSHEKFSLLGSAIITGCFALYGKHAFTGVAGDAKLMHRSDMIACLQQSPLSHLARHVLAMAAPEH